MYHNSITCEHIHLDLPLLNIIISSTRDCSSHLRFILFDGHDMARLRDSALHIDPTCLALPNLVVYPSPLLGECLSFLPSIVVVKCPRLVVLHLRFVTVPLLHPFLAKALAPSHGLFVSPIAAPS